MQKHQTPSGGYVIHKAPLVRGRHGLAGLAPDSVSSLDLSALNTVQATPWEINQDIFQIAARAFDAGLTIAGLPGPSDVAIPTRFDDDAWEALTADQKRDHVRDRRLAHEARASTVGRRQATLDHLTVASALIPANAIWYPHNRDFRGRIYPVGMSGPHPQANDLGKSLIRFHNGLHLGDRGLYWIGVRAANCAGHDKLPLDERFDWTEANLDRIVAVARDPFADTWWSELDDPWGFLATAIEIAEALETGEPENYVSHLSVQMDGTCNGLQHLSALGLDPIGARATNLTSSAVREDIYETVAVAVRAIVGEGCLAGRKEALELEGTITRKTVKRAVMTTPYGVTNRGIRMQLIADEAVQGENRGQLADYLRDCITEALDSSISSARQIMGWLQDTAGALADVSLPFTWTTPSGSIVRQAYPVRTEKRVRTLASTVKLDEYNSTLLNGKKQRLGAAPNVIHSFDASHMALTVAAAGGMGIRDFSLIHDSYGTHAGNTDALGAALRAEFAGMYREDVLGALYEECCMAAPHADLTPPPARGDFDIEEVLNSQFFFS